MKKVVLALVCAAAVNRFAACQERKTDAPADGAPPGPAVAPELLPRPRGNAPDAKAAMPILNRPKEVPFIPGGIPSVGGPLGLLDVLDSVEKHYPLLQAIEQERAIAGGKLVSAMGNFDLNVIASGDSTAPATYDNFRGNVGLNQMLPVGGMSVFGGYRNGYGDFPTYNLSQLTADGGEMRAGMIIPLAKDREIDRPRAGVQQARIDVQITEPMIERQRLDFKRAAARTYWSWIANGQRLRVAQEMVKLAVERDGQLKARVEAGPAANIERIDNQQNIAFRNGLMVQSQRAFQQSSIDLSLFLRDEIGAPTIAGPDRLPDFPLVQEVDLSAFDAALGTAMEMRPEPRRLRLQREKAAVELNLARNQTRQSLNAVVAGSQDIGYGTSSLSGPNGLDRSNLNASLVYQMPVQRREARGRVLQSEATLAQLEAQLRNAEDVIRAEIQDGFSALERAYEFYQQARSRVELAQTVARAEREQLRLGRSDILRVTLREQAAFEAEIFEISARQEYFRTKTDLLVAQGLDAR
jgi:outer membrane protein TolC